MDTTPTTPPTPSIPPPIPNVPEPKKYIRTYEGDMEAFRKGETPNLAPLKKPLPPPPVAPTQKTIEFHPSVQSPVQSPPAPTAMPVLIPKPAPIPIPAPTPRPVPQPIQPPPPIRTPEPPAPKPELPTPSPLQTYSLDFSERMKETHSSTATVLAAEQDAMSGAPQDAPEKSSRGNTLYIIAGVVLLLLGVAGSYIAYTHYLIKVEPVIIATTVPTPIPVDEKEKISGTTSAEILQEIKQSVTHTLAPNAVRLLSTDLATTTANSIFSMLQLPAPGILLRNVNAAKSMAGVISIGGTQSPFFILSVASYSDTFAGMLSWEKTMPQDLSALFPPYPQATATSTAAATTTSVFSVFFHDEVVNNHDVRVYRDAHGRTILLYGYWNQTTLVITRDPSAFMEIINRLTTARAK